MFRNEFLFDFLHREAILQLFFLQKRASEKIV